MVSRCSQHYYYNDDKVNIRLWSGCYPDKLLNLKKCEDLDSFPVYFSKFNIALQHLEELGANFLDQKYLGTTIIARGVLASELQSALDSARKSNYGICVRRHSKSCPIVTRCCSATRLAFAIPKLLTSPVDVLKPESRRSLRNLLLRPPRLLLLLRKGSST